MVSKSKAKGSYHERWFLKLWNSLGIKTKKQPLSGSLGGEYKGDLTIEIDGQVVFVEVKYRDKSYFPNVFNKSFSLPIKTGVPTGPFAKGPTIPPILSDVGSILPRVKSISLTKIPGDAKFSGILFSPRSPNLF